MNDFERTLHVKAAPIIFRVVVVCIALVPLLDITVSPRMLECKLGLLLGYVRYGLPLILPAKREKKDLYLGRFRWHDPASFTTLLMPMTTQKKKKIFPAQMPSPDAGSRT